MHVFVCIICHPCAKSENTGFQHSEITFMKNSLADAGIISEPKSFEVGNRHLSQEQLGHLVSINFPLRSLLVRERGGEEGIILLD